MKWQILATIPPLTSSGALPNSQHQNCSKIKAHGCCFLSPLPLLTRTQGADCSKIEAHGRFSLSSFSPHKNTRSWCSHKLWLLRLQVLHGYMVQGKSRSHTKRALFLNLETRWGRPPLWIFLKMSNQRKWMLTGQKNKTATSEKNGNWKGELKLS